MNANEIFGMSGAYHGSKQGSALNNFVVRMSSEPRSIGVVLLDEIEKAHQEVITSLYQVLDKGKSILLYCYYHIAKVFSNHMAML